jgi:hypothetical protein
MLGGDAPLKQRANDFSQYTDAELLAELDRVANELGIKTASMIEPSDPAIAPAVTHIWPPVRNTVGLLLGDSPQSEALSKPINGSEGVARSLRDLLAGRPHQARPPRPDLSWLQVNVTLTIERQRTTSKMPKLRNDKDCP